MAFTQRDMRTLVEGPPKIWSYRTQDTAAKVCKRDYFADFRENFAVGDWVLATTSTGGVMLHVDEIDPLELGAPR